MAGIRPRDEAGLEALAAVLRELGYLNSSPRHSRMVALNRQDIVIAAACGLHRISAV